jgi:hypothetical protein
MFSQKGEIEEKRKEKKKRISGDFNSTTTATTAT